MTQLGSALLERAAAHPDICMAGVSPAAWLAAGFLEASAVPQITVVGLSMQALDYLRLPGENTRRGRSFRGCEYVRGPTAGQAGCWWVDEDCRRGSLLTRDALNMRGGAALRCVGMQLQQVMLGAAWGV